MLFEEFLDCGCSVVRRPVDKENYFLDFVPLGIVNQMRKMSAKFNISPSIKAIPYDFLFRPKHRDKTINSFRIAWRGNLYFFSLRCPHSLCFSKEFYPLFVLKCEEDLFFKRTGAIFL